jgi:hypothetical protein
MLSIHVLSYLISTGDDILSPMNPMMRAVQTPGPRLVSWSTDYQWPLDYSPPKLDSSYTDSFRGQQTPGPQTLFMATDSHGQ